MDLRGRQLKDTYKGVLNIIGAGSVQQNLSATPRNITDGDGNASVMYLGTGSVVFDGLLAAGDNFTPSAKVHAKAKNSFDYLFRATDMLNQNIFQVRSDIPTSESVLSKYGFMSDNTGNFQISGFGATFGGDRLHLYSGIYLRTPTPSDGIVVAIGSNPGIDVPASCALIHMKSTTKGFIPPTMSGAEAEAIGTPVEGLLVYCNNNNGSIITTTGWWGYDGGTWVKLN
jgi:hypothetical protein